VRPTVSHTPMKWIRVKSSTANGLPEQCRLSRSLGCAAGLRDFVTSHRRASIILIASLWRIPALRMSPARLRTVNAPRLNPKKYRSSPGSYVLTRYAYASFDV